MQSLKIIAKCLVLVVFFMVSCKTDPLIPEHEVCFSTEVFPIFAKNCNNSGCHDDITKSHGYCFSTYDLIVQKGVVPGDEANSKIMEVIKKNNDTAAHHKHTLNYYDLGILKMWIKQGAKNILTCQPNYCDSINVTYTNSIKDFLELKCTSCHYPSNTYETIDLSSYQVVHDYVLSEENLMEYRITHFHHVSVTACERAKMINWIKNNAIQ